MVHSAIFNNVFKALNLFLNKYVAEIQLAGIGIRLFSMPQSSTESSGMDGIGNFHHIM